MTENSGSGFLNEILDLLRNGGIVDTDKNKVNVVDFVHPKKLESIFRADLEDAKDQTDEKELKKFCEDLIKYTPKAHHPRFQIQFSGGVDYYGLAGSWLSEAINSSVTIYELSPVITLVEQAIIRKTAKIFGYPDDADGTFTPGGSISNMYAVAVSRYNAYPNVKDDGMGGLPRLVLFTSEDSHFSLSKVSNWLGLGTKSVIKVKTDDDGCMIPEELEKEIKKAIANGMKPYCVNATSGTTVYGAFDDLEKTSEICKKYGIWLHVDCCWGGSLIFSKKYKSILKGIEKSDSFAWNPHKFLNAPIPCSIFMVKDKDILIKCNGSGADYLFTKDKYYDASYDLGDKNILCGRKGDAFKLWLMWKARGDNGFEKLVDNAMDATAYLKDRICERPGFELVNKKKQLTNVCFYYIPPSLRNQERTEEWWQRLIQVAPKIKENLILSGKMMLASNTANHKNLKNFLRVIVTCHPPPTTADMDAIIEEIEKCAENF